MEIDTEQPAQSETRARILSRFESWLDTVLAEEAPPEGLAVDLLAALDDGETLPPVEGRSDLYSLWSAMTGLTQEVKLQSRTFRQLNDRLSARLESLPTTAPAPQKQPEKQTLDLLLDLHDRLERGLQSVRAAAAPLLVGPRRSLLSRWLGGGEVQLRQTQDALTALDRGYALTLLRLDEALKDAQLHSFVCQGQIFDPRRMVAVALEETGDVPEGTVVDVYSCGYEWNGQLYRAAQVKVARPVARASTAGEKTK